MSETRPSPRNELFQLWRWLKQHWMPVSILLFVAAAGLLIIKHTTSMGIGLRDDSYSYFSGADGILAGQGYARFSELDGWKPLTNFPPLYSTLLTVPQLMGLDAGASARLLAGLSFTALAFMASLFVYWSSRSLPIAILASGLILFSPSLLEVNSWALSEGPYLALTATSLFLLTLLLRTRPAGWLLISTNIVVLALAALTRYVGLVLIGTSFLAISLSKSGRRRIDLALSIAVASSTPLLLFLARNWLIADSATNRPLPYWHPPTGENLVVGARTLSGWLLSHLWIEREQVPNWGIILIAGLLLLGMISFTVANLRSSRRGEHTTPAIQIAKSTLIIHSWLYLVFVILSISLFDRLIPLDSRILSPLLITLMILICLLLWQSIVGISIKSIFKAASWSSAVVLILIQLARGLPEINSLSSTGKGFNSPIWRSARIIDAINGLPVRPIYSNNVPALYFLADRHASFIPAQYDPAADRTRQDYQEELVEMRKNLEETDGFLILIGWPPENRVEPQHLQDLTAGLNLTIETRDGLVYCACANLSK